MKYSKLFSCLLLLAFVVQACYDDEWAKYDSFEEGNQVHVSLNFEVQGSPLLTRAAQEESFEYRVENVYLMIFDQKGQRVALGGKTKQQTGYGNSFFSIGKGLEDLVQGDGINPTKGKLRFKAVTVQQARIVGIANLTSGVTATAYSVTPADLDKVNTLDELKEVVLPMAQKGSIERGALFLMTGYAESNGSYDIDIKGPEDASISLNCKLKLRRVDARIEVNIQAQPAKKEWKKFSFEPRTWQVMQVPQQTLLLPAATTNRNGSWDADGENCKYFNTPERVFEVVNRDDTSNLYSGGSFTFYMPENRKQYKKEIKETAGTKETPGDNMATILYAYRDKQVKNADGTNQPQFEYANDHSTYLVLTGNLSYIDSKDYHVSTEARYIVHLGYVNKKNGVSIKPDVNDYETLRNGKYIYNLTVTGVNSIIQEVTYENEVRPGFEGHIVYSDKGFRTFDAHYDRHLLKVPVEYIKDSLKWGVNTPFSFGIYNPADHKDGQVPSGLKDYKWIKFAVNKEYGVTQDNEVHYVKYPGDSNYNDPDVNDEFDNQPSAYYKDYPNARLKDVNQLISYLYDKLDKKELIDLVEDNAIYITAFLDENLYFKNPETGEEDLTLWKKCVDKSDRKLHLIYGEAKYSKDGQSSVVNSFYTFSQKSIRTVYNIEKESLKTAWGLESSMETERLKPGTEAIKEGTDTRNGLANTLKWVVGKKWDEIIATTQSYKLNPNYDNAAFACMLRNRDLNGDNVVQAEEVRWYLASIDQLTDIYLGEYALDTEARLYPRNVADRPGGNSVYWHYTSSSYNGSEGAPWVLWAEEGASIGSYGGAGGSQDLNGPSYSYRCVRNLGIAHHNTNEVPEDLIKVTTLDNGNYLVDVSNMNVKSRRTNLETVQLPEHNELSANNRPYEYFEVHKDAINAEGNTPIYSWGTWNAFPWDVYQKPGVQAALPEGFRIPNQRELLIMTTRIKGRNVWPTYGLYKSYYPIYISYTAFSMDGQTPYSDSRDGFIMHSESMKFALQNNRSEAGYVRCVKDVPAPSVP